MSSLSSGVGTAIGIGLVNGKIRPRTGTGAKIGQVIFVSALSIGGILCIVLGTNEPDLKLMFAGLILTVCGAYMSAIAPVFVKNVDVIVNRGNDGRPYVSVFYKKQPVDCNLGFDAHGKICYLDNMHKTSHIRYFNNPNKKISKLQAFRIVNYLTQVLGTNGLLSDLVTSTLE